MPHRLLVPEVARPTGTLVSRVRQRLLHPWSPLPVMPKAAGIAPTVPTRQAVRPVGRQARFQAGVSEFLLIMRLRARRPAAPAADVLERGARIVSVTCQNWFGAAANPNPGHQTRI